MYWNESSRSIELIISLKNHNMILLQLQNTKGFKDLQKQLHAKVSKEERYCWSVKNIGSIPVDKMNKTLCAKARPAELENISSFCNVEKSNIQSDCIIGGWWWPRGRGDEIPNFTGFFIMLPFLEKFGRNVLIKMRQNGCLESNSRVNSTCFWK